MNDQDPRTRKPIPLILWAAIGFVLVFGFMVLLRTLNPPAAGVGPPMSDVVPSSPASNS